MAEIVASREADGPFGSLREFCQRLETRKVGKRVIEALISSGAMDGIGDATLDLNERRGYLLGAVASSLKGAEQVARDQAQGMQDMFGGVSHANSAEPQPVVPRRLVDAQRLDGEKETLGLYLTGHPLGAYTHELANFRSERICDVTVGKKRRVTGFVVVCPYHAQPSW